MSRFWLFLSSLAPALLIVSIRAVPTWGWLGWAGIVASVALFVSAFAVLRGRKTLTPEPFVPEQVADESTQIPTYLLTFIFPFLFLGDQPSPSTLVAYMVFVLLLLLLLYRTDLSLVNPALLIAGYHVYSVELKESPDIFVISKRSLRPKSNYTAYKLSSSLYLMSKLTP